MLQNAIPAIQKRNKASKRLFRFAHADTLIGEACNAQVKKVYAVLRNPVIFTP